MTNTPPISITGEMIYYYFVCKRKLFYAFNGLRMEHNSPLVQMGALIEDKVFKQEKIKHITIDDTIAIDMIKGKTLCEIKKSRVIEEASIWQLKYYLYYLHKKGLTEYTGEIKYPALKQTVPVQLSDNDIATLDNVVTDIKNIIAQPKPPTNERTKICSKCAYHDFCFI